MKNTKSKIRFIEAFVIATFPLALVVGCSATGEQKPAEISMQEETTVQQEASIDTKELNTLTFIETAPSDKETVAAASKYAEEPAQETQAMDNDALNADKPMQTSNDTEVEQTSLTPVNMQVPSLDQPKTKKPESDILHFAINKFDINKQDLALLEKHADYLKENPGIVINVNGYSDSRGSAKMNFELSKKRAQRVADTLISLGVSESQIKVNSYGESFPLHDEKNWDENRRVELVYSETLQDDGLMASATIH